mmetsp:Transcript_32833/g.74111  ORF Transcript_32833/g.74111 Transcript_32833/m.74111 type:complete len:232 (-) Transcript_32833:177-872(-)
MPQRNSFVVIVAAAAAATSRSGGRGRGRSGGGEGEVGDVVLVEETVLHGPQPLPHPVHHNHQSRPAFALAAFVLTTAIGPAASFGEEGRPRAGPDGAPGVCQVVGELDPPLGPRQQVVLALPPGRVVAHVRPEPEPLLEPLDAVVVVVLHHQFDVLKAAAEEVQGVPHALGRVARVVLAPGQPLLFAREEHPARVCVGDADAHIVGVLVQADHKAAPSRVARARGCRVRRG